MRSRLIGVFVAIAACVGGVHAAGVPGQGTWETTLQARDLNHDGVTDAFYDTVLDVTWLRDANVKGPMDWVTANGWANNLIVSGFGGWRLPTMIDTGAPGCDWSYAGGTDCGANVQTKNGAVVYSEMAYLFYDTLGNKAYCPPGEPSCAGGPQLGWGLTNSGDFQNLEPFYYWTDLDYAPAPGNPWFFRTSDGIQGNDAGNSEMYALAVHPGDVAAVPEPQTYALMLADLGAMLTVARRRRSN